jgi:hypothetical protein
MYFFIGGIFLFPVMVGSHCLVLSKVAITELFPDLRSREDNSARAAKERLFGVGKTLERRQRGVR